MQRSGQDPKAIDIKATVWDGSILENSRLWDLKKTQQKTNLMKLASETSQQLMDDKMARPNVNQSVKHESTLTALRWSNYAIYPGFDDC